MAGRRRAAPRVQPHLRPVRGALVRRRRHGADQGRHRRRPGKPERGDRARQGPGVARPPLGRPLPVRRGGGLEPRGDGGPRDRPTAPLLQHARAGRGDQGDLDPGRGRVPRRARRLRSDVVVAQAGAGTAPAGGGGGDRRQGDRPGARLWRRVVPEPAQVPRGPEGAHRDPARAGRPPREGVVLRGEARAARGRAARLGGRRPLRVLRLAGPGSKRGGGPSGPARGAALMGRLDELDLSLKLSKEEEAERLEAGWARLEALRLALGGKVQGYGLGPPVCIRVEGLASEPEWRRAYGEICEMEKSLAAGGMVLIKFFMHISDEEQLERFEKRRDNPLKAWKLTEEDWHNRTKRPQYLEAVEEMIERTDHEF